MPKIISRRGALAAIAASLAGSQVALRSPPARADDLDPDQGALRGDLFDTHVIPAGMEENDIPHMTTQDMGIPPGFGFPDDAVSDRTRKPIVKRENTIFGIDLNYGTHPLSINALAGQNVGFVYLKASQGDFITDRNFAKFWKACGRTSGTTKVYRGAYHFVSHNVDGEVQANYFCDLVEAAEFRKDDLSPVIDLEWDVARVNGPDRWIGMGADAILNIVKPCLTQIEKRLGRKPIIYTANSWFSAATIPKSRFHELSDYEFWLADYNPKRHPDERVKALSGKEALVWQFASNATLPGYGYGVDASVFHGSVDDLKRAFGAT